MSVQDEITWLRILVQINKEQAASEGIGVA
jgi:hypothetical protein